MAQPSSITEPKHPVPLECLHSNLLNTVSGLSHGFFTRHGGMSSAPFNSLNGSFHVGDEPLKVMGNRQRMLRYAGFSSAGDFITLKQCHGATLHNVTQANQHTFFASPATDLHPQVFQPPDKDGDALFTHEDNLPLGILTADCCCLLWVDAKAHVIAASHIGWRGLKARLIHHVVHHLIQHGATPHNLHVAVGPCIPAPSYPVGPDFVHIFPESQAWCFQQGDQTFFNLHTGILSHLKEASIQSIESILATTAEKRFFSFRRNKATGRCLSFIGWQASHTKNEKR